MAAMERVMVMVLVMVLVMVGMNYQEVIHNNVFEKRNHIFLHIQGPIPISRGEVAQTIYDWILVKTVAFDFKIISRSRGRRFIAALSDIGGYRCCSIRNALFSVFSGNQTFIFLAFILQWIKH